jgi:hypothetical protein
LVLDTWIESNKHDRTGTSMIKKIIFTIIVLAISASVAYQMDLLSFKGEDVYEETKESVIEKGGEMIEKGRDAID